MPKFSNDVKFEFANASDESVFEEIIREGGFFKSRILSCHEIVSISSHYTRSTRLNNQ